MHNQILKILLTITLTLISYYHLSRLNSISRTGYRLFHFNRHHASTTSGLLPPTQICFTVHFRDRLLTLDLSLSSSLLHSQSLRYSFSGSPASDPIAP
ncbi:hypothetical protein L2E82_03628 [Cichorium intybus]|uniref:Uncharacterized protein n=1 Tax=Cichorium intybus TaxID=13427 RepID=A0ACB9H6D2_CICIN|nr:hypothetical protein L2E82_03628 [Cichorium intybus]